MGFEPPPPETVAVKVRAKQAACSSTRLSSCPNTCLDTCSMNAHPYRWDAPVGKKKMRQCVLGSSTSLHKWWKLSPDFSTLANLSVSSFVQLCVYIVMVYIVMVYIVMVYIVMAQRFVIRASLLRATTKDLCVRFARLLPRPKRTSLSWLRAKDWHELRNA